MKIGLLQEGDSTGTTPAVRYHELIEEVALADKLGFSTWGTSEQHFNAPGWTVSAPEVLYAAVAMRTERIKLRPMSIVLMPWNHPITVAERFATLDVLSKGRAELNLARSNNMHALKVFEVNPAETRTIFSESLSIIEKIFTNPEIEHAGKYWNIEKAVITPTCIGGRFPKISFAATSLESHANAAKSGYGVITFDNFFGLDYLDECLAAYRQGWSEGGDSLPNPNNYFGVYVATAYCAPTREEAAKEADHMAVAYFNEALRVMSMLASQPGYEYMGRIMELQGINDKPDWLRKETASVMIGTPEDYIERLKFLESKGVDEVLLRLDGYGHEKVMNAIELIGKEVLPAFS
ncbi:MAG: hypothetical protein RL268_12 [Pseudomonadota bacterium]|jgi:alkanesulfonate monooxygenase SsuD/methylene tetrahydromethanopterin reductase-like flavin-dependent oxidoreductase (luciferase family)